MTDPSFRESACEQTHALSYDVSVTDDGADVVVRVVRELPTDQVPDFARKFVGSTLTVIQTETWHPAAMDGSRAADVHGEIKGTPAGFTGTAAITGGSGRSVQSVNLDVKVSVPLIGKKIEPFIAQAIEAALSKEQQLGQAWYDERR